MKNNRLPIAIGVIAGLLSGPAIALGASAAFSSNDPAPAEPAAQAIVVEAIAETTTTTTLPPITEPTTADDLAAACGPDGMTLVGAEASGTATELELAALDALRDVCDEAGKPLPAPQATVLASAPEEIIIYETVDVPAPATATAPAQGSYVDDDDHEEHEDDDDYYADGDEDSYSGGDH